MSFDNSVMVKDIAGNYKTGDTQMFFVMDETGKCYYKNVIQVEPKSRWKEHIAESLEALRDNTMGLKLLPAVGKNEILGLNQWRKDHV